MPEELQENSQTDTEEQAPTPLDMTPEDLVYCVARGPTGDDRLNTLDTPKIFQFST